MLVISSSYGNDSCALIQWARNLNLDLFDDVFVVFIDTGWSHEGWLNRVEKLETWVKRIGFTPVRLSPAVQFEDLMVAKGGFPNQRYQWCSGELKGKPFLMWIEKQDPMGKATVLIGKRREESAERENTDEFVESSSYHGGRRVWHPLYLHTDLDRDILLLEAGIQPLPHRSLECHPCINANRSDLLLMSESDICKVEGLESEVGNLMFRAARYKTKRYPNGCHGIREVIAWAKKEPIQPDEKSGFSKCSSGYCGH